jgi:uncharacterized membrane protein
VDHKFDAQGSAWKGLSRRADLREEDVNLKQASRVLLGAAILLYPFAAYLGLESGAHEWLGAVLIGFGVLRLWPALGGPRARAPEIAMAAVMIGFGAATLLVRSGGLLLFYPCLMSMTALSLFALSMVFPPTVIERFARLREPTLPTEAVRYCRRVNLVWCLFLAANSTVALWTVLQADHRVWLLYNGFLSYVLMGALFVGEFVVRTRLRARHQKI